MFGVEWFIVCGDVFDYVCVCVVVCVEIDGVVYDVVIEC